MGFVMNKRRRMAMGRGGGSVDECASEVKPISESKGERGLRCVPT